MPSSIRFGHPAGSGACAVSSSTGTRLSISRTAAARRNFIEELPLGLRGGPFENKPERPGTQAGARFDKPGRSMGRKLGEIMRHELVAFRLETDMYGMSSAGVDAGEPL